MPDLSRAATAARATIESTMVDTCAVTRDAERETDDVLDETTLALNPAVGEPATIYEGACSLSPRLDQRTVDVGGRQVTVRRSQVRLPSTTPEIRVGDKFTLTASASASPLEGRLLTVTDVLYRTHSTSLIITVEERAGEAR